MTSRRGPMDQMGSPAGSEQGVFSSPPIWRQPEARLASLCQRADLTLSTKCFHAYDPPVGKYVCMSMNMYVHKKLLWLFWTSLSKGATFSHRQLASWVCSRDARLLFVDLCFHHVSLGNLIQLSLAGSMLTLYFSRTHHS